MVVRDQIDWTDSITETVIQVHQVYESLNVCFHNFSELCSFDPTIAQTISENQSQENQVGI